MFFRFFLFFTLIPLVELFILIKIGTVIGALPTVGYVIVCALVGVYIIRLEGLYVLVRMKRLVSEGKFPGEALIDGFLIIVAGALLITPGLLTDITGFFILVPATRVFIKQWLKKKLLDYMLRRR